MDKEQWKQANAWRYPPNEDMDVMWDSHCRHKTLRNLAIRFIEECESMNLSWSEFRAVLSNVQDLGAARARFGIKPNE